MKFTLNLPMASGAFQAIPPGQYLDVAVAAEAAGSDLGGPPRPTARVGRPDPARRVDP